ncbi:hypothetical protein B0H19DRAFT_1251623 [Mycena capillaripes]|nr:hypothetical protein B0H19DRAFT_1251623 [Mycena capillaripes]
MSRPAPLLLDTLDSFPAPPSFIPPSPFDNGSFPISPAAVNFPRALNPPPSQPPTAPLPPIPGPSRISDTESLLLRSSAAPSRSRSKPSLREHRDSVASTRSSISTRSPQTPSSAAQSLHRPSLAFSIDEHRDDLLDGAPLLGKAPLGDSLEDLSVPVPPLVSARTPPRTTTPRRESIALTSVAIPAPDSDTEPDFDALDPTPATDSRAPSPDIATILATTPRPRLATGGRHTPPDGEPWEEDFIDDYGEGGSVRSASVDFAFGYPDAAQDAESVSGEDGHFGFEEPNSDADSDLDLHTSLPQLMLHHGFLSPRSKLLPHPPASLAPSPAPSPASAVFPNAERSLPRDTRDTPNRRVRHRDGKLLRGGIGLTTGLGWSDSEDEDAPSALTRRISSLNLHQSASQLGLSRSGSLSTRASTFSHTPGSARTSTFSSTRSSSYSRSTSRARRVQSEHEQTDTDVDEFGTWGIGARKGSAPPTSWARRSDPTSRLSRAQSQSALSRVTSIRTDDSSHTTTSAFTSFSASSLPLMRTRSRVLRDDAKPLPRTPILRRAPSSAGTPSTSGSISRPSSRSGMRPRAVTNLSGLPQPHARVPLSMQSTPQPGLPASSSSTAVPPLPAPVPTKPQMRPLRLPQRLPVLGGDRAPVPVPEVLLGISTSTTASSLASSTSSVSVLSASTSATSVSLLSPSTSASGSLLATPSSPYGASFARAPSPYGPPSPGFAPPPMAPPMTPRYDAQGPGARPKPRTGTGMVYRSTSSTYGVPGPGRLPVRTPGKVVAL